MHVLIIDDDKGDVELLRARLEKVPGMQHIGSILGHEYGKSRLSFYSKADEDVRPNVIVIEAKLSGGSAVDLVRFVKKSSLKTVPIVIYTGTDDEELKRACLTAGVMKVIPKGPKGPEELVAYLATLAPKAS